MKIELELNDDQISEIVLADLIESYDAAWGDVEICAALKQVIEYYSTTAEYQEFLQKKCLT